MLRLPDQSPYFSFGVSQETTVFDHQQRGVQQVINQVPIGRGGRDLIVPSWHVSDRTSLLWLIGDGRVEQFELRHRSDRG